MTERETISRNQIVSGLLRIGHGDLGIYQSDGIAAANEDAELFGHFLCWNSKNGEVRDSKVAFPVLALRGIADDELFENAVANLCLLDPRNFLRAVTYHKSLPVKVTDGGGAFLKKAVKMYLKHRQHGGLRNSALLQHRKSMKALYALYHETPDPVSQAVLFDKKKPKGSVFEAVANLKDMTPTKAAGEIMTKKIPFLVAVGALGGIKDKPDVIIALMDRMSGSELINNTKSLKRMGVFENPVLSAAYEQALEKVKTDKKVSSLKASVAAKQVGGKAKKKMKAVQEKKLVDLGGIKGDWLVLGDASSSMHASVEIAKQVAALISQQALGTVDLIFFNQNVIKHIDATNKTLEEIEHEARLVRAGGMTSCGAGIDYIKRQGRVVNGIAIITDGGENQWPHFSDAYIEYSDLLGIKPAVYMYHISGDRDTMSVHCKQQQVQTERFELGHDVDYYSLPNLIKTMRANRYALVDEMMEIPLLTLKDVFSGNGKRS